MKIERDRYVEKLTSRIDNGAIKVITGVRRAGKSFLLFELFYEKLIKRGVSPDHIITVSLDDVENAEYRDPHRLYDHLRERIKGEGKYFIFLDEVQLAISREELKNKDSDVRLYGVLNALLKKRNVDVYVTGSNSKLLSTDVLTEFRGRGDEIRVLPLSFAEFTSGYNGSVESAWTDYLTYGGMPRVLALADEEQKVNYLDSLVREIYLKDIDERYEIRKLNGMEEMMKITASAVGSLTNPQKIADTFKSSGRGAITSQTIKEYLGYLCDACLIKKAERYDVKGRKYISTPSKYYYCDTGLRNAVLEFRQFEETHLMENVIYNELLRRGFSVDVGVVNVHAGAKENGGSVKKQLEIDFVANLGSRRYYVQSAYAVPDAEKLKQEEESLVRVPDSFKKIIVTGTNTRVWHSEDGVTVMNIFDFLLNENSLEM